MTVGVGNISRRFYVDANASKEVIKRLEVNILANLANIIALAFFTDCVFEKNLLWAYIIGIGFIIVNISSQVKTFLSKDSALKKILPFDIIVPIAIAICLLWLIKDEKLQEITTTIVAALVGGFLTLLGVAWTIRRQDEIRKKDAEQREKERKEEEKKKAKPYFIINMMLSSPLIRSGDRICFNDTPPGVKKYEANCEIQNSNQSIFTIKRVFNDDKWEEMLSNNVVLPNMTITLSINCNEFFGKYLEVEDILGNLYYYEFKILKISNSKTQNTVYTMNYLKEVQYSDIEKNNNNK